MKSKEELAKNYSNLIDRSEEGLVEQCFIAGFEKAEQKYHLIQLMELDDQTPKWKTIEEYTPKEDTQILCCLLNKWAKEVSRYSVLRYFQGNWYGDITEDETVEKWMEIPQ